MRILLILLIVGFCLVTAKYIPHDASDTNSALYRIRRSYSDSDSNTASVERDDDSSNGNDNEDEDNDSSEKSLNEARYKLLEKEEKKKQKLLEKIEKQKQKEIEERRKQEEKLTKALQKEQEKKEKEERKSQEKIEKERKKLEEENRKAEQKLEKEERKRQEKLKKQLEKLQKEQIESAEDTYLETEEEDSVEMEDIWKIHVYDKYGLNITSTKLERQSALQRYLQEEMGINANSTKSDRRQAILKLIHTKLQNDSVAVDSVRNLLLSHVNAAQIQKLKSKLDEDLEELNNKTDLLSNISDPWVSETKQNIEEKRTFLQAIAQFLSNIVPNWFGSTQNLDNSTQTTENGIVANSFTSSNPEIPNAASGSDKSVITNTDASESNLSVLPSYVGSGSSSSTSLKPNEASQNDSMNTNVPANQTNENGVTSNTGMAANSISLNEPKPASSSLPSNNLSESSGNSISNVPISSSTVNGLPSSTANSINSGLPNNDNSDNPETTINISGTPQNFDNSDNVASPNVPISSDAGHGPSNPPEENGSASSSFINNSDIVSQPTVDGLPSSIANTANSNAPALTDSSKPHESGGSDSLNNDNAVNQVDISGTPSNVDISANAGSLNEPISINSGPVSNTPSEENGSAGSNLVNSNDLNSQTSVNGLPSSFVNIANSDVPNTTPSSDFGSTQGNPSNTNEPMEGNSLNNNIPMIQTDISGTPANIDNSAISVASSNPLEENGFAGNNSVNNNNPISQTGVNGLPSTSGSTANSDVPNVPASTDFGSIQGNPSKASVGSDSVNNNNTVNQVDISGTSTNVDNLANADSPNEPIPSDSGPASNIPSEENGSAGTNLVNSNDLISQTSLNGLPSSTINIATSDTPNVPTSTDFVSIEINPTKTNVSVGSDALSNNISVINTDSNRTPSNVDNPTNAGAPIEPIPRDSETASSNPSEENVLSGSNSVNNINITSQTSVSEIIVNTANKTGIVDLTGSEVTESQINPVEGNVNGTVVSDLTTDASATVAVPVTDALSVNGDSSVTAVISTNTEEIFQSPNAQDRNAPNAEVNTGIEALTTLAVENDVTQVEVQTEQSNFLVQEIVNTPNDIVTDPSIQHPSLPQGVIVPVEPDASVVDIKQQ